MINLLRNNGDQHKRSHTIGGELLLLDQQASTEYEHHLVEVISKLYGLLSSQEMRFRVLEKRKD